MLRSSIYAASALALSAAAFAQKQEVRSFERVTGPVKHAGVYHLATGQWTRGAAAQLTAGAGSDIVYNCTTDSGYYAVLGAGNTNTASTGYNPTNYGQGVTMTNSGRLPSLTSPNTVWNPSAVPVGSVPGSAAGCANTYTIDGFEIGYCSETVGPNTAVTIAFYEVNPTCTAPAGLPQGGPFAITGLPGHAATAALGCWLVTIDLAGQTLSFNMQADGDGSYLDNTSDAFAWSFTFPSTTSSLTQAGFLLNGAPADASGPNHPGIGWLQFPPSITTDAAGYDGTRFDGPSGANAPTYPTNGAVGLPTPGGEDGSDMVGDDGMRLDGNLGTPGCYFFGGPVGSGGADGPYTNFHMELYAKTVCAPPPPGTEFCFGDGLDPLVTVNSCPCANFGAAGRGCASSFNASGAHITGTGVVATDTAQLLVDGVNATGNVIFMRGDINTNGGIVFGDGVRCVDGVLIRRTKAITPANQSSFPLPTDTVTLSTGWGAANNTPPGSGITAHYMAYYRNAAGTFCPPATFNGTNAYVITW
ncbi:MAG: hypothetical protein HZA53_05020 [Planctomycetes bacterium]|nr:hypothetical protein [Planctomycetota bacterium]